MVREFHLGDLLSVTDGHLLSPRKMEGVSDLLSYMTGERLWVHALIRAADFCTPYLLGRYPFLVDLKMPSEFTGNVEASLKWLDEQVAVYGEMFEVEPLPEGEWNSIDPIEELVSMIGPDRVIVVPIEGPSEVN